MSFVRVNNSRYSNKKKYNFSSSLCHALRLLDSQWAILTKNWFFKIYFPHAIHFTSDKMIARTNQLNFGNLKIWFQYTDCGLMHFSILVSNVKYLLQFYCFDQITELSNEAEERFKRSQKKTKWKWMTQT